MLYAPNRYVQRAVQERYLALIQSLLSRNEGLKHSVSVEVGEPLVGLPKGPKRTDGAPKAAGRKPNGLKPSFTFDTFVQGEFNRLAYAAAQRVVEEPGGINNPLLLYGGVGLGKTHLMQAIGHQVYSRHPDLKIAFCHGQVFVEQMVTAFQQKGGAVEMLVERYRSAELLLLDDVQFLSKAYGTQREFLGIFNRLTGKRGQVVVTCNCFPGQIEGLEEGLKSRLGAGFNVEMRPPEKAVAVTILMREAELHGVVLTEDVAEYIAELAGADVRGLKGAFQNVVQKARFIDSWINMALAREALDHLRGLRNRSVLVDSILQAVAIHYGLKCSDILSKRRFRRLVRARHMAMCLAKELTHLSYSDIGKAIGGNHYSTVKSACGKIESLRRGHPEVDDEYRHLVKDLKG